MISRAEANGRSERAGSLSDTRFEARVLEALQGLLARYLFDPAVTLIDVGEDSWSGSMVLQVHVRSACTWSRIGSPSTVNGIPVRAVVPADEMDD